MSVAAIEPSGKTGTSATEADANPSHPSVLLVSFGNKIGPEGIDRLRNVDFHRQRKGIISATSLKRARGYLADVKVDMRAVFVDGREALSGRSRHRQLEFIEYLRTQFPDVQLVTVGVASASAEHGFTICEDHVNAGCRICTCWENIPTMIRSILETASTA